MIKAFITALLLLITLTDIFDFNIQSIIQLFSVPTATAAPVHAYIILVKTIALPETFMRLSWFLLSFLFVIPTIKSVAMTVILTITAIVTFALHKYIYPVNKNHLTTSHASNNDTLCMKNIVASARYSKSSRSSSSAHLLKQDNDDVYAVFIGDLFPETEPNVPVRRLSYADAVGYEFMEIRKPRHVNTFTGYDVFVGDLFPEEYPNVPASRLSYADAVGYSQMEMRKPRHVNTFDGYDLFIGDLFPEDDVGVLMHRSSCVDAYGRRSRNFNSFCGYDVFIGDLFPENDFSVPARRFSYADAVGYSQMESRKPRHVNTFDGYDVPINDLFDNHEFQLSTAKVKQSSYADLAFISPRQPEYFNTFTGYDIYIGDLFTSHDTCESVASTLNNPVQLFSVTPTAKIRRISYADAVGYSQMESRASRKLESFCGYNVSIGDLFSESTSPPLTNDGVDDDVFFTPISYNQNYSKTPDPLTRIKTNIPQTRRMSYAEAVTSSF